MECNVARDLNAGLVAFYLVDLNLLHAKHIKKLRRACKLSSTGLTRTVTAGNVSSTQTAIHSDVCIMILMIEVDIYKYFRWEHVGALSFLNFHLQQIWPGTLSTDELRRALCGVGLKTADAPQRNRARKPWKTWKHDETCGLTDV